MIRTLSGVAAGIGIAIVLMMITEALGSQMFPPPREDLNDPNSPAMLPVLNQIFPIVGWFVATLAGGWFAIQVSERDWTAWLVAASVLVGEILDYLLGRHAVWAMLAGLLAPVAAAWLAQKLPGRSRRASA